MQTQNETQASPDQTSRLEEALWRRVLIDQARDGMVVIDEQGKVIEANQRFAEMLGRTLPELFQLHLWDWDAQWTREALLGKLREVGHSGEHFQTRHRRKDGSVYHVDICTNAAQIDGRKLVFCVCRDLTERPQAETALDKQFQPRTQAQTEAALRLSNTTLQALIESSQTGILFEDTQRKIVFVNPAFCELFGGTPEAMSDLDCRQAMQQAKQAFVNADEFVTGVEQTIAAGQPVRHVELQTTAGRLLERDYAPVKSGGVCLGHLWHYRDITERQTLRERLLQTQKLDSIGQLAGGIAHDFNNILAAMILQLTLLRDHPGMDIEMNQALNELDQGARRAADLTRQLLMFSRRSLLQLKPTVLNAVVENLLKMLRRLIGEHIDLHLNVEVDLPDVLADEGILEQMLVALAVHARDTMPNGGRLTIATGLAEITPEEARFNPDARPGTFAVLSIQDTSPGLDSDSKKRIFEPFYSTREISRGNGLGLATVYGAIKQQQGWIEVESRLNVGTTFKVFLPLAPTKAPAPPPPPTQQLPGGSETILLVEDELPVRQALRTFFQRWGYTVIEAANGPAANAVWQSHRKEIDLLFTDVVMPGGISGLELAHRFHQEKPDLKVILSSGYSANLNTADIPDAGDFLFVPKPCPAAELAKTIRQCLDS
jgi:PAS domain S-box-containing protein